jgi:glucan 1,3-beta-glucosidase
MKFNLALSATVLLPGVWSFKGLNMGGCLEQAEWLQQFNTIKSWGFDSVRLYSSSSCDTIMRAAPAAIQANIILLAGIWAVPDENYAAEKAAFLNAVQTYGTSYLAAVSVGSESLYRKEIDPNLLASRVKDVKGIRPFNESN